MVQSMTGFGRAEATYEGKTYLVEIKALNGKQFDLQLRMPSQLKPYEFEIRKNIQQTLLRGSVECYINLKQNGTTRPVVLNTELIASYYEQVSHLARQLGVNAEGILSSIIQLPEVVSPSNDEVSEEEYNVCEEAICTALKNLKEHRSTEGAALQQDLEERIKQIGEQEKIVMELAPGRKEKIRENIEALLAKNVGKENTDPNRLEQELVYYIEKIDIHEEQIRLEQHCDYFLEILRSDEESKGKKLSFVLQEIGREINTTGSKAYNADIQKAVVTMKDELEKAKEQVLNVL